MVETVQQEAAWPGDSSGGEVGEEGPFVLFRVDGHRFALHLDAVDKVVQAVEVTPVPGAESKLLGVVSHRGTIVPVIDMRRLLNLPTRDILLSDHLVFAKTRNRPLALVVDSVEEVLTEGKVVPAAQVEGVAGHARGILPVSGGLVLIHDLDQLLSREDEVAADRAIEAATP